MNKTIICTALLGVFAAGIAAAPAMADDMGKVKCYGVAKAGKNGCKDAMATHSCAGQAKADNQPGDWVLSSSMADCEKMGGKTEAPKAM